MRTRPLSPTGDFTIGLPWYVNNSTAVAQSISTRLKLWFGEWFLDVTDGTPYLTDILGERYKGDPNAAIKRRILGTPGVTGFAAYSSTFDGTRRSLTVNAVVNTQFSGQTVTLTGVQLSVSSSFSQLPMQILTTESGATLTTQSGTALTTEPTLNFGS